LLGIGYEVLVVRVLAQVSQGTVYTMALLLAVYLLAAAGGAAIYARGPRRSGAWLPAITAIAGLLGAASLWFAGSFKFALLALMPAGLDSALLAEAVIAIAAFAAPSACMGALFAHLASRAVAQGAGLGRALAVNTFGAALAPPLFGVWLFPLLGPKFALLLVCLGYLLLSIPMTSGRLLIWGAPVLGALVLALATPRLAFVDVPPGGRILRYEDGVMATVGVVEDAGGVSRLRIDNRQQEGSSATRRVDARQGLLPVLLHPGPREVLFLGLGTGVTARAAAATMPQVHVDVVELVPEVISASALFAPAPQAGSGAMRVLGADARRYVRTTLRRYDVIVSDNFHPARSGSAALYTVEHFAAVRARLSGGGLFCQWLPLHQMDLDTLRLIVASFLHVFPEGAAVLASNSLETPVIGLVGRPADAGKRDSLSAAQARVTRGSSAAVLAEVGIDDSYALLGSFVAGSASLARFASGAPLNTDDHPRVAWRAPRITYVPQDRPRDRLIALLDAGWQMDPQTLFASDQPQDDVNRVTAYWHARNLFLRAGRDVQVSTDPARMLAQVEAPLLEVLRISPDFRPAYDPLVHLAGALSRRDPDRARDLLVQLAEIQPSRREALVLLQDLPSRHPLGVIP
ncbi:MAG: spermidine synthase, partial [Panacagrimonas sp.]